MQFPPEAVREIARLLSENELGEISFEAAKGARLTLKRAPRFVAPAAMVADAETLALSAEPVAALETLAADAAPDAILVAAPCVGVFHEAKDAVEVGSALQKKQLLGVVESLRVPYEIYAPSQGVVAQVLVGDGQGVEWGQPLFEIQPGPAPQTS